jgi:hypothetical protein
MFAFTVSHDGFVSRLDDAEREILARLIADVALLVRGFPAGPEPLADAQDPIGHLDFDPEADRVAALTDVTDPALVRLFPPMSASDPAADELRQQKLANLSLVAAGLAEASGSVNVRDGDEARWLAALTDLRLVLAARLGIEDDAAAEEVHALALAALDRPAEDRLEEQRMAFASLYTGVTWWQESLLRAVTARRAGD